MITRCAMHPNMKQRGLQILVWCGLALIMAASTFARAVTATPSTYFFLVFSDPAAGQEAEYNRWYNDEHGPDVTSIPGFVNAQRFEYAEHQLREVALKKPKYLIIYRIVTADPAAVRDEIIRRAKNGQTRMSPTITNVKMYTYREFRPEMMGAGGATCGCQSGSAADLLSDRVRGCGQGYGSGIQRLVRQSTRASTAIGAGICEGRTRHHQRGTTCADR